VGGAERETDRDSKQKETTVGSSSSKNNANRVIKLIDDMWEVLSYDKAIHKACQVMRDISRTDRKYRQVRKNERLLNKRRKLSGGGFKSFVKITQLLLVVAMTMVMLMLMLVGRVVGTADLLTLQK